MAPQRAFAVCAARANIPHPAVGVPGIPKGSPLELFSWQIASIQLSQNNDVQELQCSVDSNNNLVIPDPGDQALLGGLISRLGVSGARTACSCLASTQFRNGLGVLIGGPDVRLRAALCSAGGSPSPLFTLFRFRALRSWQFRF